LITAQHQVLTKVLAATHVHLDHHNCLEVIILKGRSSEVQRFGDHILSIRGVKHGKLALTSTEKGISSK
jgi:CopG family nickel-responsive transcriptional regulator